MLQSKRVVSSAVERDAASFRNLQLAVKTALHPKNHSRADLVARIQAMGERPGGEVLVRQSNLVRSDERATLGDIPQQLTEVILAWLDEVSLVDHSPTQR